jgi:DNA-binding transcriptional regulator YhcF (GntR family)
MELDPEDPRPRKVQIANQLRAAILTKTYKPGDKLPSGPELAKTFGVAKQTVAEALTILHDEGYTYSRQGAGVYVRDRTERPIGLRPHLERTFEAQHVTIDFAGFSGETLHGVLQEPLDKIRVGKLTPETIKIRLLLPDTSAPMVLPCQAADLADSPAFRARATRITERHVHGIADTVAELASFNLVKEATTEIRVHRAAPLFKLYILNNTETFFGFYPVREHTLPLNGEPTPIYDLMGKDATLFHHATNDDPTSTGTQYVTQARTWFQSMWTTISRDVSI